MVFEVHFKVGEFRVGETSKIESDGAPKIIGEEGVKARNDPRLSTDDRLLVERLCKLKSMAGEENCEDELERALEMYESNGGFGRFWRSKS